MQPKLKIEKMPQLALDMYVLGQGVKTGVYRVCDELFSRLIKAEGFSSAYFLRQGFEEKSLCYAREKGLPGNLKVLSAENHDTWPDILLSPFGVVPAAWRLAPGVLQAHIIYDLIAMRHPDFFTKEGAEEVRNIVLSLDKSTVIFAISEHTKQDLLTFRPDLDPEQIVVIPLAAGDSFYHCDDRGKCDEVRTRYGIPLEVNYILSLATLEVRKNLDQVVRAFVRYLDEHPRCNLHLVLAGMTGWKLEKLDAALAAAGQWRRRIVLTGYVEEEDLAAIYSDARCFLYLSRYEGFGLPPLEAMACGTPVITSNNSSLPEVVGDAGLTFDADDIEGVSRAIARMVESQEFRGRYALLASERAKLFSWDRCAQTVSETLLTAVIKNSGNKLLAKQGDALLSASFLGYTNGSLGPSFKKQGWKPRRFDGAPPWPVWKDQLPGENASTRIEGGLRTRGQFKNATPDYPLVTYITVVRNNEATLARAIKSVQRQTYPNVEHVVLDGASTDNTLNVIRKYEDKIDYYVSEPDLGLYAALNKAIPLARGNLICVLNSDDWLEDESAAIAVKYLGAGASSMLLLTSARVLLKKGGASDWQPAFVHPGSYFICPNVCHNGVYATRSAYENSGPYDVSYLIAADSKWIMQCLDSGSIFCYTKETAVNYALGGVSGDAYKHGIECVRMIRDRFPFLNGQELNGLHHAFFVFGVDKAHSGEPIPINYTEFIRKLFAKYAGDPDFLQALAWAGVINMSHHLDSCPLPGMPQRLGLPGKIRAMLLGYPRLYRLAALLYQKFIKRV